MRLRLARRRARRTGSETSCTLPLHALLAHSRWLLLEFLSNKRLLLGP